MAILLCMCVLLTHCSSGPDSSTPSSEAGSDAAPPDSVRIGGVTYYPNSHGQSLTIPSSLVKRQVQVGEVKAKVSSYELQEGQATALEPGTPLYAVRGYDPSFRIAARTERPRKNGRTGGAWSLYEVWSNPGAKSAAELLDVRGKVERVSLKVFGTAEQTTLAKQVSSTLGAEESKGIANAALDAKLRRVSGAQFNRLLVFHLEDGTQSIHTYDPNSGELYLSDNYKGVMLPEEYRKLLMLAS